MNRSALLVIIVLATAGTSIPVLLAFKGGAEPGHSGGPIGYEAGGGNCTLCHEFHHGSGRVDLSGLPRRYRPGVLYDLTVRVVDPDIEPAPQGKSPGAGFEISSEGEAGHLGMLLISDAVHTQYADDLSVDYVTHTLDGYDDSRSNWEANGGSYEYQLQWEAPDVDSGRINVFVAAIAANDSGFFDGDHYYAAYAVMLYAQPGDGDGDTDADLGDFAVLQQCFSGADPASGEGCEYLDSDDDGTVSLLDLASFISDMSGPTTDLPAGYVLADAVRGGLLYDKWWAVNGASEPTEDHPLWAFRPDLDSNTRTGSATWRCKECHGWDYKGVDGAYGSGSHRTGFGGIWGTTLTPREIFELLKADDPEAGGHDMDAAGMSDGDIWDVVKMVLEGTVDTDTYINGDGSFNDDPLFDGVGDYFTVCWSCHGDDGTGVPGVEVGAVAVGNPWEFLHKVRFGHPATPMPSLDLLGWDVQRAADIGAYAVTLAP